MKLLGLKDGRLASLNEDHSITIFSKNDLEPELTIKPKYYDAFNTLFQLNNGKLVTSIEVLSWGLNNIKEFKIIIISLIDNNSYNIDQIIPITSTLLKIIELNDSDSIASFEYNGTITIYSKSDLNYITKTTFHDTNYNKFSDLLYLGNNEIMCSLSSIKFLNLRDMQYIHEIKDLNATNEIIKLNKNMVLVSSCQSICKLHIIDILKYQVNSTIILDSKIKKINSIQKSFNGNILLLMDNDKKGLRICKTSFINYLFPQHIVSDYFFVYKFESSRLEKIYELEEQDKYIKLFAEFDNGKIAFKMYENNNHYIKVLDNFL